MSYAPLFLFQQRQPPQDLCHSCAVPCWSQTNRRALAVLERTVVQLGKVGLDNQFVGDLGVVKALGHVEQMFFVVNLKHDCMRALRDRTFDTFSRSVRNLRCLEAQRKVCSN